MNNLRITASKHAWDQVIGLYIFRSINNKRQNFDGEKWNDYKEMSNVNSSFSLSGEQAQYLIDTLWDCGIRPTEGNGSAGAMRATEKHLEDMRTITFKFINEKKGEI